MMSICFFTFSRSSSLLCSTASRYVFISCCFRTDSLCACYSQRLFAGPESPNFPLFFQGHQTIPLFGFIKSCDANTLFIDRQKCVLVIKDISFLAVLLGLCQLQTFENRLRLVNKGEVCDDLFGTSKESRVVLLKTCSIAT